MDGDIHITYMRHGRSRADDENVIEGRYDSPLTDVGREQARIRGEDFKAKDIRFDATISSTLARAVESARIITGLLGVSLELDRDWMEVDNGPLAGLAPCEAERVYPVPDFKNPFDPFVVSTGEGESAWDLHCRAVRATEKVIRRGPGRYLVVAHGGILNAALRGVVGTPPPVQGQGLTFRLGDTGYVRTTYRPHRHQWVLEEMNPGL